MQYINYTSGYLKYPNNPMWTDEGITHRDISNEFNLGMMVYYPVTAFSLLWAGGKVQSRVQQSYKSAIRQEYRSRPGRVLGSKPLAFMESDESIQLRGILSQRTDEINRLSKKYPQYTKTDLDRIRNLMAGGVPEEPLVPGELLTTDSKSGIRFWESSAGQERISNMERYQYIRPLIFQASKDIVASRPNNLRPRLEKLSKPLYRMITRLEDMMASVGDRRFRGGVEVYNTGRNTVQVKFSYDGSPYNFELPYIKNAPPIARDFHSFVRDAAAQLGPWQNPNGRTIVAMWSMDTASGHGSLFKASRIQASGNDLIFSTPAQQLERNYNEGLDGIMKALMKGEGYAKRALRKFENEVLGEQSIGNHALEFSNIGRVSTIQRTVAFPRMLKLMSLAQSRTITDAFTGKEKGKEFERIKSMALDYLIEARRANKIYIPEWIDSAGRKAVLEELSELAVGPATKEKGRPGAGGKYSPLFDPRSISASSLLKGYATIADRFAPSEGGAVATPHLGSRAAFLPGIDMEYFYADRRVGTRMGHLKGQGSRGVKDILLDANILRYNPTEVERFKWYHEMNLMHTIENNLSDDLNVTARKIPPPNYAPMGVIMANVPVTGSDFGLILSPSKYGTSRGHNIASVYDVFKRRGIEATATVYDHTISFKGSKFAEVRYKGFGAQKSAVQVIDEQKIRTHNKAVADPEIVKSVKKKILKRALEDKMNLVTLTEVEAKAVGIDISNPMNKSGMSGRSISVMFSADLSSFEAKKAADGGYRVRNATKGDIPMLMTENIDIQLYTADNTLIPWLHGNKTVDKITFAPVEHNALNSMLQKHLIIGETNTAHAQATISYITGSMHRGMDMLQGKQQLEKGFNARNTMGVFTKMVDNLLKADLSHGAGVHRYQKYIARGGSYRKLADPNLLKMINAMFDTAVMGRKIGISEASDTIETILVPTEGVKSRDFVRIQFKRGLELTERDINYSATTTDGKMKILNPNTQRQVSKLVEDYYSKKRIGPGYFQEWLSSFKERPIAMESTHIKEVENLRGIALKARQDYAYQIPLMVDDIAGSEEYKVQFASLITYQVTVEGAQPQQVFGRNILSKLGVSGAPLIGPLELLEMYTTNPTQANYAAKRVKDTFKRTKSIGFIASQANRIHINEGDWGKVIPAIAPETGAKAYDKLMEEMKKIAFFKDILDESAVQMDKFVQEVQERVEVVASRVSESIDRFSGATASALTGGLEDGVLQIQELLKDELDIRNFRFDSGQASEIIRMMKQLPTLDVLGHDLIVLKPDFPIDSPFPTKATGQHPVIDMIYKRPLERWDFAPDGDFALGKSQEYMDHLAKIRTYDRRVAGNMASNTLKLIILMRMHKDLASQDGTTDLKGRSFHRMIYDRKWHDAPAMKAMAIQGMISNTFRNIVEEQTAEMTGKSRLGKAFKTKMPYSMYANIGSSTIFRSAGSYTKAKTIYMSGKAFSEMMGGSILGIKDSFDTLKSTMSQVMDMEFESESTHTHMREMSRTVPVSARNMKSKASKFLTRYRKTGSSVDAFYNMLISQSGFVSEPGIKGSYEKLIEGKRLEPGDSARILEELQIGDDRIKMYTGFVNRYNAGGKKVNKYLSQLMQIQSDMLGMARKTDEISKAFESGNRDLAISLQKDLRKAVGRKDTVSKLIEAYTEIRNHKLVRQTFTGSPMYGSTNKEVIKAHDWIRSMIRSSETIVQTVEHAYKKDIKDVIAASSSIEGGWTAVMDQDMDSKIWGRIITRKKDKNVIRTRITNKLKTRFNRVRKELLHGTPREMGHRNVTDLMITATTLIDEVSPIPTNHEIRRLQNVLDRIKNRVADLPAGDRLKERAKRFAEQVLWTREAIDKNADQMKLIRGAQRLAQKGLFYGRLQGFPNLHSKHGSQYAIQIVNKKFMEGLGHKEGSQEYNNAMSLLRTAVNSKWETLWVDPTEAFLSDRDFDGDAVTLYGNLIDEVHGKVGRSQATADSIFATMNDLMFIKDGDKLRPVNMSAARNLEHMTQVGPLNVNTLELQSLEKYLDSRQIKNSLSLLYEDFKLPDDELNDMTKTARKRIERMVHEMIPKGDRIDFLKKVMVHVGQSSTNVDSSINDRVKIVTGEADSFLVRRADLKMEDTYLVKFREHGLDADERRHLKFLSADRERTMEIEQEIRANKLSFSQTSKEAYDDALMFIRRGPDTMKSYFSQKDVSGKLFKYTWFTRMMNASLQDLQGADAELTKTMQDMTDYFAYSIFQQPSVQGKKGVPDITSELKMVFNTMLYGMPDNPWVEGEGLSKTEIQRERFLQGKIKADITKIEHDMLAESGFLRLRPATTVGSLAEFHTVKAMIADEILTRVNKKEGTSKGINNLMNSIGVGTTSTPMESLFGETQIEEFADKVHKKVFGAKAKMYSVIDPKGIKAEDVGFTRVLELVKNMGNHIITKEVDQISSYTNISPTDHPHAILKAMSMGSIEKANSNRRFLSLLLDFQGSGMKMAARIHNLAKDQGILDVFQQGFQAVMSVKSANLTKDTFADVLSENLQRDTATGRSNNLVNAMFKKLMPIETYEAATRMAAKAKGDRLFWDKYAKFRPKFIGGPNAVKTAASMAAGMVGMSMLAPMPRTGTHISAISEKHAEIDFELPTNTLRRYNNVTTIAHVPTWVQEKQDKINRAKQQYVQMFHGISDFSLVPQMV